MRTIANLGSKSTKYKPSPPVERNRRGTKQNAVNDVPQQPPDAVAPGEPIAVNLRNCCHAAMALLVERDS